MRALLIVLVTVFTDKFVELIKLLIGNDGVVHFSAMMIMALIGATVKLYQQVKKRDVQSRATPEKFSTWFMIRDNLYRMISTFVMIFVFIRFRAQLLTVILPVDWVNAMNALSWPDILVALAIGYFFDVISQALKDKVGLLRVDRDKIM